MKNQVIKCLTREHGKEIIKYWKSKGVDTGGYLGCICEKDDDSHIYYGFINDSFSNYRLSDIKEHNVEIIELPIRLLHYLPEYLEDKIVEFTMSPVTELIKIQQFLINELKPEEYYLLKGNDSLEKAQNILDEIFPDIEYQLTSEGFDITTNEGRLAYAKKHYPIGTEIYNHYGEYRKLTSEPRKFGERVIDVGTMNSDGLGGFCTTLYTESKGWVKIIEKDKVEETKVMETQKLSRKGLKEIHSIACTAWKSTLEEWGNTNPLEDYIELTQEQVNNMFKACTSTQLAIVSKYLKEDDGSVDVSKVKYDSQGALLEHKYIIRHNAITSIKNSFWLNPDFNWEVKMNGDTPFLVPTKKK